MPFSLRAFTDVFGLNWHVKGEEVGRLLSYREYTGDPTGVVTPDFIGQRIFDDAAGIWYLASGLTSADWSRDISRAQVLDTVKARNGTLKFAMGFDSITDQNTRNIVPPAASPSQAFFTDGYMTWARAKTRQRFQIDVGGDFGRSGDTIQMALARIGDVIAYNPTHCINLVGSNNFAVDPFTTMRDEWLALQIAQFNAGITPIVMPCPPRETGFLTDAQARVQTRFTNWQREYCYANRGFLYADYLGNVTDQTNPLSPPLANLIKADGTGLHPVTVMAERMGTALAVVINAITPPMPTDFSSAIDYYHATDNPTGNLLYTGTTNRGLMAGTAGALTADANLTHVGQLATGFTAIRSGSSVCTWTHTKENPRTDPGRASGERQIEEIAIGGVGDVDEVYNIRCVPPIADVAAGDLYYAEVNLEILTAPTRMTALELYLLESRPTNSQTAIDMGLNSATALFMPTITDIWTLRTPVLTRQSDATALQFNVRARFDATTGSGGVKFVMGDPQTKKVAA